MFYLYSLQVYAIICYAILTKWYFIAPTRLFKLYAMIWEIGTKGLMICYGMSWNLSKNLSTQRNFKHWKKKPHKHAQNIHDTTLTFKKRYIATDDSFNYLKIYRDVGFITGALYHQLLDIFFVGPNTIITLMLSFGKGCKYTPKRTNSIGVNNLFQVMKCSDLVYSLLRILSTF